MEEHWYKHLISSRILLNGSFHPMKKTETSFFRCVMHLLIINDSISEAIEFSKWIKIYCRKIVKTLKKGSHFWRNIWWLRYRCNFKRRVYRFTVGIKSCFYTWKMGNKFDYIKWRIRKNWWSHLWSWEFCKSRYIC